MKKYKHVFFLRDISQAYTQSITPLTRDILCWPAPEVIRALKLGPNTVMKILKPLYGFPEAGNHWFGTYSKHLKESLSMQASCFDPCLLITNKGAPFGITGIQVDDTLFLATEDFVQLDDTLFLATEDCVQLEDSKIKQAKLKAKDINRLEQNSPLHFYGLLISLENSYLIIQPNGQGNKINLLTLQIRIAQKIYKKMRALGAWLASSCQPL